MSLSDERAASRPTALRAGLSDPPPAVPLCSPSSDELLVSRIAQSHMPMDAVPPGVLVLAAVNAPHRTVAAYCDGRSSDTEATDRPVNLMILAARIRHSYVTPHSLPGPAWTSAGAQNPRPRARRDSRQPGRRFSVQQTQRGTETETRPGMDVVSCAAAYDRTLYICWAPRRQ